MMWVYELPETVRTELMNDAREMLEAVQRMWDIKQIVSMIAFDEEKERVEK